MASICASKRLSAADAFLYNPDGFTKRDMKHSMDRVSILASHMPNLVMALAAGGQNQSGRAGGCGFPWPCPRRRPRYLPVPAFIQASTQSITT